MVLMKTVTAMDLDAFVHHVVEHLRGEDFHHRAFRRVLLDGLHLRDGTLSPLGGRGLHLAFDESGYTPGHGLGCENPNGHFGKFVLDSAEVSNSGAKGFSLLRVLDGDGEHILGGADRRRTKFQAPNIEHIERDDVTTPDFSQDVLDGNSYVIEINRSGGRAANTHLMFLGAAADTRKGSLHEEGAEFFASDFGEDGKQIGRATVGNPHFLAVEYVVLAVGSQVGTSSRGRRAGTS